MKDNRLLPRGWSRDGPGKALTGSFLKATHPGPAAQHDPRYNDGSGRDELTYRISLPRDVDIDSCTVRATLYYQALPPYFLQSLFRLAPEGPATRRLHFIASNIDLRGTPVEGWKLKVATVSARAP